MEISYRTGRYAETDALSHVWEIADADGLAAELWVSADTGEIANIWTRRDLRGRGLARSLWETATAQMTVTHAPVAHRTPEGDAFAQAVGGPTATYPCSCYGCSTEE